MNDLEIYFKKNTGRLIYKWQHYFEIYDKHFSRFRGKEIVVLEIGVFQGGSLQMWKNYFGPGAKIYGIDIDPRCKNFEEENIKIFTGSQSDKQFLAKVKSEMPPIDILIDDGGHSMKQQIISFKELFNHIKQDGIYLCEDCHTSYLWEYGGGYRRPGTFIEYTKNWIDYINAYHARSSRLKVNEFTRNVKSLHYYDSIVVVEKGKVDEPVVLQTGTTSFGNPHHGSTFKKRIASRAKWFLKKLFSFLRLPYWFE